MEYLTKEQCHELLDILISTGADFAEVFLEETKKLDLEVKEQEVTKNSTLTVKGSSLRIVKNNVEYSASVTNNSFENLVKYSKMLSKSLNGTKIIDNKEFKENTSKNIITIETSSNDFPLENKINILKEINQCSKVSDEIVLSLSRLYEKVQNIFVFSSDGTYCKDNRSNIRFSGVANSKRGELLESFAASKGFNSGYEIFEGFDFKNFGKEIGESAINLLSAITIKGGEMPVIINNGFGGVILHEALGHSLEATSVAEGLSVFSGKLGEKVASDIVTAVDDGTLVDEWGSINYDDEGTETKRNVLIENGVLKSYLVDKVNSNKMNHPITGSSRRESYKYSTTSRMTNTFFENGKSKFDDLFEGIVYGLFAKSLGGGSVNPITGEFNFAVNEAFLIENGKITKQVKGVSLIGLGTDVLKRIDMIADNLKHAQGMCGSKSGSITTNVGQPTIRLTHMTVGGTN